MTEPMTKVQFTPDTGDTETEPRSSTGIRTHTFHFDREDQRKAAKKKLVDMIATEYLHMAGGYDPAAAAAFDEMVETNRQLFDEIPVDVVFTADDPYASYSDMAETVGKERELRIWNGGDPPTHYIGMTDTLKGRAVHDWYGHLGNDVDFSLCGEFKKWDNQRHHYSEQTQKLLFAIVVGQLCLGSHLGGFGSDEFVNTGMIAPDHWITAAREYVDEFGE